MIRRGCWIVASVALAGAVIISLLPPSVDVPALAPTTTDPTSLPILVADPAIAEDIVVANVFAASRMPPATRYSPADLVGESANGMPATTDASPDEAPMHIAGPRLLGTVVSPDGPKALLQLNPALASARLYAEGDADAGYRIVSITPRVVVLRGPGGRVTLRLDPEEDRP